jgi:hypothetical protein
MPEFTWRQEVLLAPCPEGRNPQGSYGIKAIGDPIGGQIHLIYAYRIWPTKTFAHMDLGARFPKWSTIASTAIIRMASRATCLIRSSTWATLTSDSMQRASWLSPALCHSLYLRFSWNCHLGTFSSILRRTCSPRSPWMKPRLLVTVTTIVSDSALTLLLPTAWRHTTALSSARLAVQPRTAIDAG